MQRTYMENFQSYPEVLDFVISPTILLEKFRRC